MCSRDGSKFQRNPNRLISIFNASDLARRLSSRNFCAQSMEAEIIEVCECIMFPTGNVGTASCNEDGFCELEVDVIILEIAIISNARIL
jgi:hypothetical protein